MNQRDTASRTALREWLTDNSKCFQYAATLTLTNAYASAAGAQTVARRFHHKFNKAIWGGNRCHTHKIAWLAVVHGDEFKRYHVHAAIGNIPQALHFFPALQRFKRTFRHTEGTWQRMDFWPIETDGWCDYMTRVIRDGSDTAVMLDELELGTGNR